MQERKPIRKPIPKSILELERNLEKIATITEWALLMGYNRSYFSRTFREHFKKSPKEILKKVRMKYIMKEIKQDPYAIGYKIAVNVGLADEKALYKFLMTHYSISINELREYIYFESTNGRS